MRSELLYEMLKYYMRCQFNVASLNPKRFDYVRPRTLEETVQILHDREDAKVLAGGQSLLALMKLRLFAPGVLVDLASLRNELSYIRTGDGHLAIGALTTHDTLEHDKTIGEKFPIIVDAANRIGDQQIRNMGTIGGSCCHAEPAADLPTALLALDPTFIVQSSSGERKIPAAEFFVDIFTTSVAKDEILKEVRIPYLQRNSGSAYVKHSRRRNDFAIVGAGAVVTVGPKGVCTDARISLGAVASTPIRAKNAERYLVGKKLGDASISEAAERAREDADPPSDIHGSREYRLDMIGVFAKRALFCALDRVK